MFTFVTSGISKRFSVCAINWELILVTLTLPSLRVETFFLSVPFLPHVLQIFELTVHV